MGVDIPRRESLSQFLNKLRGKKQTGQQQKQASHAISIYYEIESVQFIVTGSFKNKKEELSTKKENSMTQSPSPFLKPAGVLLWDRPEGSTRLQL